MTVRAEGAWTQSGASAVLANADNLLATGCIDLSGVTTVDSAGVALMLELSRRAKAGGKTLRFIHAPPALATLATFFGVDALLQLQGS